MRGVLESINVSPGGVPKARVLEARITASGVSGDRQRDSRHHGGSDRAVVLYSLELIKALQEEGHPIAVGTTGENLTVSGLDWSALKPGTELTVGDARLVITDYAAPCRLIASSFHMRYFSRVSQDFHPGWSRLCARVLTEGVVKPGDEVAVNT